MIPDRQGRRTKRNITKKSCSRLVDLVRERCSRAQGSCMLRSHDSWVVAKSSGSTFRKASNQMEKKRIKMLNFGP